MPWPSPETSCNKQHQECGMMGLFKGALPRGLHSGAMQSELPAGQFHWILGVRLSIFESRFGWIYLLIWIDLNLFITNFGQGQ